MFVRSTGVVMLCLLFINVNAIGQDITINDCMECHNDKELVREKDDGTVDSLYVDQTKFSNSIHGELSCVDCHEDITELPHEEKLKQPDCSSCHDDVMDEYMKSIHGIAWEENHQDAPMCWDCHSAHYVYPSDDSLSTLFILNQPKVCAPCHSNPEIIKKYNIPISRPCEMYKTSVHFKAALEKACLHSARCTDCHGGHDIQPSVMLNSKTNRMKTPETCSKCHPDIYEDFINSVHGKGLLAGVRDAPTCTDCHTEHGIKDHLDPSSTVYSTVISKTLCPQCHEAIRIVSKYRMNPSVVESYNDSYHGLANRAGSVVTANCASCHGVHDILPSADPNSRINKNNLTKTCGTCHPGVSEKVALGSVHVIPSSMSDQIIYYIRIFYLILIVSVIGGMLIHNGLDFIKKARERMAGHEGLVESTGRYFVRLTVNERIQHFLLMSSFILLVITGFALVYPDSLWALPFKLWSGGFAFRGLLHRVAAATMVLLSIYHVFYLLTTKRGKKHIIDFLPTLQDGKDVLQMFKYYFGRSSEKPKFGRYNYMEKAEYWALIWGTIVMSLTGFILWFEDLSLKYFPKWVTDVSTAIHFYEALLATLAIVVWHFYYQFFDPHVYPMNTTCITGKISEETMREEHPLEFDNIEVQQHTKF